jgi:hypothetical protein
VALGSSKCEFISEFGKTKIDSSTQDTAMMIQEHSRPQPNLVDLQTDRINILEQIGKTSAANIKVKLLVKQLEKQTIAEIEKSFNNWVSELPIKLTETSKKWSSKHSYWTSRDRLVKSYCYKFGDNLSTLLKQWVAEDLGNIIKSYSANIYDRIHVEFDKLDDFKMCSLRKPTFVWHNCLDKTRYNHQESGCDYTSLYRGDKRTKKVGFFEGVQSVLLPTGRVGGVGVGLCFLGFALPIIPVTLAIGSIASIVNIIDTNEGNSPELYDKIKAQVIQLGCADIKKTELPKVRKDIIERIKREVFGGVMNCTDDGFACVISQYETIFESLDRQIDNN